MNQSWTLQLEWLCPILQLKFRQKGFSGPFPGSFLWVFLGLWCHHHHHHHHHCQNAHPADGCMHLACLQARELQTDHDDEYDNMISDIIVHDAQLTVISDIYDIRYDCWWCTCNNHIWYVWYTDGLFVFTQRRGCPIPAFAQDTNIVHKAANHGYDPTQDIIQPKI